MVSLFLESKAKKWTYVGEVVLRQHGVGGVGRAVVVEDNVLLVLAALDNLGSSSGKLVLDLFDDRDDKRRNDGEDKAGQLLL